MDQFNYVVIQNNCFSFFGIKCDFFFVNRYLLSSKKENKYQKNYNFTICLERRRHLEQQDLQKYYLYRFLFFLDPTDEENLLLVVSGLFV